MSKVLGFVPARTNCCDYRPQIKANCRWRTVAEKAPGVMVIASHPLRNFLPCHTVSGVGWSTSSLRCVKSSGWQGLRHPPGFATSRCREGTRRLEGNYSKKATRWQRGGVRGGKCVAMITVGEVFRQIPTKVMQCLTAGCTSNPAIAVGVVLVALGMALSWLVYRLRDARQSGETKTEPPTSAEGAVPERETPTVNSPEEPSKQKRASKSQETPAGVTLTTDPAQEEAFVEGYKTASQDQTVLLWLFVITGLVVWFGWLLLQPNSLSP
mmetsp:Transcript_18655/g.31351  ORF Transcript_18655/g.31351 Transcript_18655/m.31351 type:complete len:268 (-) Transcript_18655:194-997(-)